MSSMHGAWHGCSVREARILSRYMSSLDDQARQEIGEEVYRNLLRFYSGRATSRAVENVIFGHWKHTLLLF